MHLCKKKPPKNSWAKIGAFTNSIDPDEMPQKRGVSSGSALFAMLSTFLVHVILDNIKSYINQDLTSLICAKA